MKDYTHLIDKDYIQERDKLIPAAVERANKEFGAHGPGGKDIKANMAYAANWSRVYHAEVSRLWRERV